jgi:hypothetical protein
MPWKPRLNTEIDLPRLPLTPEEGFVASRLDGATDLHGLSLVTGLSRERVEAAMDRLVALGAVPAPEEDASEDPRGDENEEAAPPEESGTDRALYESALRALPAEERAARAHTASEPELSALCFDPLPAVVHALLENPAFSLRHARLVAAHHPTPAGLEALSAKARLAADAGVRRALLRNAQLPVAVLRRLQSGRRLLDQYKLVVSHEVPEQTRRAARDLLRSRFATAEADERVEVIVKTEGRCLGPLAGLPVDGKTTALLCGRPYTSTLLVQNVSRWTTCPPSLIAHLLKQEVVRRSPALKLLLQRHPNAPPDARR